LLGAAAQSLPSRFEDQARARLEGVYEPRDLLEPTLDHRLLHFVVRDAVPQKAPDAIILFEDDH